MFPWSRFRVRKIRTQKDPALVSVMGWFQNRGGVPPTPLPPFSLCRANDGTRCACCLYRFRLVHTSANNHTGGHATVSHSPKSLAVSRHLDFSIDRLFSGLLESPFTKTILFLENCRHSQGKHNVFKSFYPRVASNTNPLHSTFLTRLLVLRFNLYQGCPDVA